MYSSAMAERLDIADDTLEMFDKLRAKKGLQEDTEISEDNMLRLLIEHYGINLKDDRHKKVVKGRQ